MRYLSVCSGIEAATTAWHPLGFEPAAFAEIEKAPSAVLAHHYPTVPNVGDFTKIEGTEHGSIDLLVGGTPCQSFSIAGLRGGLSDERGNLALEFIKLAYRSNSRWVLWENVPGVLSSSKGNDFRSFLAGLTGVDVSVPQKGWKNSGLIVGLDGHFSIAWRVLDAQYFGVPQRRRRVFVVGHLGDWRRAASVLFERESLRWHPAPSREKVQEAAGTIGARTKGGGGLGTDFDCDGGLIVAQVAGTLSANKGNIIAEHAWTGQLVAKWPAQVASTLNAHYGDKWGLEDQHALNGAALFVPYAIQERAVCENPNAGPDGAGFRSDGQAYTLEARTVPQAVAYSTGVRRLTPTECERLQGFPDNYTLVPYGKKSMADGPRYKMLGNSMAVPCMAWIGKRIQEVDGIKE